MTHKEKPKYSGSSAQSGAQFLSLCRHSWNKHAFCFEVQGGCSSSNTHINIPAEKEKIKTFSKGNTLDVVYTNIYSQLRHIQLQGRLGSWVTMYLAKNSVILQEKNYRLENNQHFLPQFPSCGFLLQTYLMKNSKCWARSPLNSLCADERHFYSYFWIASIIHVNSWGGEIENINQNVRISILMNTTVHLKLIPYVN